MAHAGAGGATALDGGEQRDLGADGGGTDRARVGYRRTLFFHRVDDQHDLAVLDHVHDVRPALGHLVHHADRNPGRFYGTAGAARGDQGEAQCMQFARNLDRLGPVRRLDAEEDLARLR